MSWRDSSYLAFRLLNYRIIIVTSRGRRWGSIGVDALQTAVDRVKKGELESGVDAQALAQAKFTVVFDLDDTLYDQYYKDGKSCHGFAFKRKNGKMKYIQPVPGWDDAIRKIVALGGKVVLFSANLDDTTLANLAHMTIDGKPLTKSPLISGIMTNSHLTQQGKVGATRQLLPHVKDDL